MLEVQLHVEENQEENNENQENMEINNENIQLNNEENENKEIELKHNISEFIYLLKLFKECGFDINCYNDENETPFHRILGVINNFKNNNRHIYFDLINFF